MPDHLKTEHPGGRGFTLTQSGVRLVFFCENEAGAERWEAAILKLVDEGLLQSTKETSVPQSYS